MKKIYLILLLPILFASCSAKVNIVINDNEIANELEEINKLGDVDEVIAEPEIELKRIHTVGTWAKDRACLWNIALQYSGNPYDYIMIYQANSEQIENPDLIYPGQKLVIPYD